MEIICIDIDLRVLMDVNVIVYRILKSWSWQKTKAMVDQRVRRGTATLTPRTPSTSVRWSGSPWMGSTGRETLIGGDKSRVVLYNQCHWWMPARHTHCIFVHTCWSEFPWKENMDRQEKIQNSCRCFDTFVAFATSSKYICRYSTIWWYICRLLLFVTVL